MTLADRVEDQVWKFIRFVFGVVTVGILVNLASDYLGQHFPPARGLLVQMAAIAVVLWLLVLATRMGLSYFTSGRYAVEALILNSQDELLLYRHPHHKRMLPPGGRVKHTEFPHLALQKRLQERVGLTPHQYRFEARIHHGLQERSEDLGEIQRVPAPFLVQRELHQQRTFVRLHYDFIYVLRLLDDDITFEESPYAPVQFVNISTLQNMVMQGRTFPDVLNAYRRVLQIASGMRDDSDSLSK